MIIGHGLIASAFINSPFDSTSFVVFASGVSNSTESNPAAYAREVNLLIPYLAKNTTLIYFSTTSIFDPSKKESPYIQHKVAIENLIREGTSSYLIVRLPILIGHTSNPHTLINFLTNAIRRQQSIRLHTKACRHLLDIDDLVPALIPFEKNPLMRQTINLLGSEKISIPLLVEKIQTILQLEGDFIWEDVGACYDVMSNDAETICVGDKNYVDHILKKYLG